MECDNLAQKMNERIVIDPATCNGRPIVRGTRITVQTILEFLASGDSFDEILADYPSLSKADIEAALQYASRLMGNGFTVEAVA